jgi:hypothetical protein
MTDKIWLFINWCACNTLGGCAAPMTQRGTVSEAATKQEADKATGHCCCGDR